MSAKDFADLLKAEKGRPGFSAQERARMWNGVATSLHGASAASASVATSTAVGKRIAASKLTALMAVTALGGAGVGAAAHARWAEPHVVLVTPPATVSVVAPPAPPAPPAPRQTTESLETPASRTSTGPVVTTMAPRHDVRSLSQPGSAQTTTDSHLARDRTLLDIARTALTRGDSASALQTLDVHAREFPASQLVEEREVLAIQALAAADRLVDARRRASAFRIAFPKSALMPIVDESTQ